jgi:hypothetical protein
VKLILSIYGENIQEMCHRFLKTSKRKKKSFSLTEVMLSGDLEIFIVRGENHTDFTKIIRQDIDLRLDQYKLPFKRTILKIYPNIVM